MVTRNVQWSPEWYHVVPTNDLRPHKTSGNACECRPTVRCDDGLLVHNAWDNREFDEMAVLEESNHR